MSPRIPAMLVLAALAAACSRGDEPPPPPPAEFGGDFGADHFLQFPNHQPQPESYARAFYATIDPCDQRETLEEWLAVNGFDDGDQVHVIFRDTKDLGYGRDMRARRNANGTLAFYVQNFQVQAIPGQNYSPMNLDAAIAQDYKYHIGTNAIEWGPLDGNCNGTFTDPEDVATPFTRHYTFEPAPVQARRLVVDLDGKGLKAMPVPCILCHGGRADPLLPEPRNAHPESRFPRGGDTRAKLQPLDVESFEYSDVPGFRRADLEAGLKQINEWVYASYEANAEPPPGEWDSSMAREMLEFWYDDPAVAGLFDSPAQRPGYLPAGWVPDPSNGSPPAGADVLYREVLAHNCRTCHLLRGIDHQSDIDFTTYDKFIGHAPQVEEYIYDRGVMPLAFLTFDHFWETPGQPELLASFLPEFSRLDGEGRVLRPGRPIAKAGPDRRSPAPVTLSGTASLFAQRYEWSLAGAPAGAVASLTGADTVSPVLSASVDGEYLVDLTVVKDGVRSAPDRVVVTIDAAMSPAPSELTFEDHIKPVMQGTCASGPLCNADVTCVSCHRASSPRGFLPPVFWSEPAPGENRDLYADVRARIDFTDPENSKLLLKPTGHHHAGLQLAGFDLTGDRQYYDLFLNWILEGARRE